MKTIIKIFLLFITSTFIIISHVNAEENLNLSNIEETRQLDKNDILENIENKNEIFYNSTIYGAKGFYGLLFRVANDIKNIFLFIASLYFLILVIRLIYSGDSEEGFTKFKKGIIWITAGIIIIQISYSITKTLYDKNVDKHLAINFYTIIVEPLLNLIIVFASIAFLLMAIRAFYFLITANGNEESIKKGKNTIMYSIIGIILIKLTKTIVEGVYGEIKAGSLEKAKINPLANSILNILNRINGFIGLLVIIMIIYIGLQILTSGGDEEKLKKSKKSIIYIGIGIFILIANYIIIKIFF